MQTAIGDLLLGALLSHTLKCLQPRSPEQSGIAPRSPQNSLLGTPHGEEWSSQGQVWTQLNASVGQ